MNNIIPYTIIGAGGHARAVLDALRSSGKIVQAVIDLEYKGDEELIMGVPVKGDYKKIAQQFDPNLGFLIVAVGNNNKREAIFNELIKTGYKMPAVIHSTALITSGTVIGEGCYIGAGAIINTMVKIGVNTIINTGAIIEHESVIGSHAHVAPGVRIAGRVDIGDRNFIGIGSTVIDRICLEKDVTVGAGSVVIKSITEGRTVLGVPAREL